MNTCPPVICSHALGRRLSLKLALFTMAVLSLLFTATWFGVGMLIKERNAMDLGQRCELMAEVLGLEARAGGEAAVLRRILTDAPLRQHGRLQVWRADGSLLHADPVSTTAGSRHLRTDRFEVMAPGLSGGRLTGEYTVDFSRDASIGRRWAWVLVGMTLLAGVVVSLGSRWHVQRQLRGLNDLAAQTRAISPAGLDQRLHLADPAEELLPFIDQFNALMGRLQGAYQQLEAFNADVAHELRTPLATLIGQTELALSRERPAQALRETLSSNLEEMQRLAAMVNDMLFLSQADRGAVARRGSPVSLAELATQVAEFHEGSLLDAGLALRIEGDVHMPVDEPLVKRAVSNLLGNATRFARPGSTLRVHIAADAALDVATPGHQARVLVENLGETIPAENLPRLFDRFFRADSARHCPDSQHHGLGLAIVAAIARMHGGQTHVESAEGRTRVGFTLATG
jgi:two-component system heavy metal sensor histidine kinase CusS